MKAFKLKSVSSELKETNTKVSLSLKIDSRSGLPTPKNFDSFIPWICLQFQVPRIITIRRLTQEEYRRHRKSHSTTSHSTKLRKKSESASTEERKDRSPTTGSNNSTISKDTKNALPVTTYYNSKGYLVEIAFINCSGNIHRKVIQAINLCLPFHPAFYKITIRGGGLTQILLNEISKLLPYSNITEVCLDDNYVAEGNYQVILEKENRLQTLSLRRCRVDDEICKRLADMLHYGASASKTLLTLDLSSNRITNVGTKALGEMLRTNRTLLHLGLADNKITDTGAFYIYNSLLSFRLNDEEVLAMKNRYLKYCFEKVKIYEECKNEIINRLKGEAEKKYLSQVKRLTEFSKYENEDKENRERVKRVTGITKNDEKVKLARIRTEVIPKKIRQTKKHDTSLFLDKRIVIEQAEKMTKEIIGEFTDILDDQNIRYERSQIYSIGNLKLCSLNLAYNDLSYLSVRKVYEILKYQNELSKPAQCKGLLRVLLDGNNIPLVCEELDAIDSYLQTAVTDSVSISEFNRSGSSVKSSKRLHTK